MRRRPHESQDLQGSIAGVAYCPCVTCAIARKADRRDAALMLRATRIQGAGVTPAERVRWDAHLEESAQWRERVQHARA